MPLISHLLQHLAATYRIHSLDQFLDLLSPEEHPTFLQEHRCRLMFDRIRFLATLMAILVPLWLLVDLILLPLDALLPIVVIRVLSTLGFAWQARDTKWEKTQRNSWLALGLLLINLPIAFFASAYILLGLPMTEHNQLAIQFYSLLPYIAVGMLGLFPLTVLEGAMLMLPLSLLVITGWSFFAAIDLLQMLPTVWLLLIVLGIVFFTSTLQLQYMISFIGRSDFDPVTGALTRRSGMENLIRLHEKAAMNNESLAVALVELDDGQKIIDDYGYATYDHVVQEAADILRDDLRHSDLLVRWGEQRFLLILHATDCEGAAITVDRIRSKGIGTLPDDKAVTASIGVVERAVDRLADVKALLNLVEARCKQAQRHGKDRAELCQSAPWQ
ncbi:MAG: GGDEF domain-containing protein [Candidatus Thiodiazotropha sp.]